LKFLSFGGNDGYLHGCDITSKIGYKPYMEKKITFIFLSIALASLLFLPSLTLNQHQQHLFLLTSLSINQTIEQVKQKYESDLLSIDGVVGVGISECENKPCIKVYLENESLNLKQQIPKQLDGFKVETQVMGAIEALPQ
jgi:hypothetical protein